MLVQGHEGKREIDHVAPVIQGHEGKIKRNNTKINMADCN